MIRLDRVFPDAGNLKIGQYATDNRPNSARPLFKCRICERKLYLFEPIAGELDLSNAVREEVMLAINQYVVCDPKCSGLCPRCGTNLNQATCDCRQDESDPRWEALQALKDR